MILSNLRHYIRKTSEICCLDLLQLALKLSYKWFYLLVGVKLLGFSLFYVKVSQALAASKFDTNNK